MLDFESLLRSQGSAVVLPFALGANGLVCAASALCSYFTHRPLVVAKRLAGAQDTDASPALASPASSRAGVKPPPRRAALKAMLRLASLAVGRRQACLLICHAGVLVVRSFLSLQVSQVLGGATAAVMQRSWAGLARSLSRFSMLGVVCSVVNAAMKYLEGRVGASLRRRATREYHRRYLRGRNYYSLAIAGSGADQRIASDLREWSSRFAELFGRTFKPLLDVILSTRLLATTLGLGGPSILYSYFLASSVLVAMQAPQLSRLVAAQQEIERRFQGTHSRLVSHAEEVAFCRGEAKERMLMDVELETACRFSQGLTLVQFQQGAVDQWTMKYCATIVGFSVVSLPLMRTAESGADLIQKHRTADMLIGNASAAIGDLILVHKKAQQLGGFSLRLVELLDKLGEANMAHAEVTSAAKTVTQKLMRRGSKSWCDADLRNPSEVRKVAGGLVSRPSLLPQPLVRFESLTVESPDGRVLLRNLSLAIRPQCNLFVTGPNGCGKTSLFRVLAGLWAPASGAVMAPSLTGTGGIFYLPQRPYLVCGSLRDQVLYPQLEPIKNAAEDASVVSCLERVGLGKFAHDLERFEEEWDGILSGGEKQRLAFARLLYHRPTFAVLDEATAAVNMEAQEMLYSLLADVGVTFFSIAHRAELRKFHQMELCIEGDGTGAWQLKDIAAGPCAELEASRKAALHFNQDQGGDMAQSGKLDRFKLRQSFTMPKLS